MHSPPYYVPIDFNHHTDQTEPALQARSIPACSLSQYIARLGAHCGRELGGTGNGVHEANAGAAENAVLVSKGLKKGKLR